MRRFSKRREWLILMLRMLGTISQIFLSCAALVWLWPWETRFRRSKKGSERESVKLLILRGFLDVRILVPNTPEDDQNRET